MELGDKVQVLKGKDWEEEAKKIPTTYLEFVLSHRYDNDIQSAIIFLGEILATRFNDEQRRKFETMPAPGYKLDEEGRLYPVVYKKEENQ